MQKIVLNPQQFKMNSRKNQQVLVRVFFTSAVVLMVIGIFLISIGSHLLKFIITTNLQLTPDSRLFDVWKRPPFSASIDFYFFNWTNPEDIYNKSTKPKFDQVGPFRYFEKQSKSDIVWNENGTVTFRRLKFWQYRHEEVNENLEVNITSINPIALASAHVSRTWNYIIRKGLSLTLSSIAPTLNLTRTAREMLFDGYPDTLIKIAKTFPFFADKQLPPWDKFGWFYARNGSLDFDGVFNMGTGVNSKFGKLYRWNHWSKTPYFEGDCGDVDGFLGDIFEPSEIKDYVTLFSSDICRKIALQFAGTSKVGDIIGNKYVAGDNMFDNGTLYPENACFCGGECLPAGVFNVSSCRYGSPSFASLPHFYKADSYYRNLIEGMKPDAEKHDFYVVLEPTTGIPLKLCARFQLNLLLQPVPGISMYANAPRIFFPVIWFEQKFKIPESKTFLLKLLLKVPIICSSIGSVLIIIGLIFLIYGCQNRISNTEKSQYLFETEPLKNDNLDVKLNKDYTE